MFEIRQFVFELNKINFSIYPGMSDQERDMLKEEIARLINKYNLAIQDYEDWGDREALRFVG
jgi:hypothetical protein|tara:strand:- start:1120 stop:1305 length:186 start_codon:yes stop_codon:yes gene_type:complete